MGSLDVGGLPPGFQVVSSPPPAPTGSALPSGFKVVTTGAAATPVQPSPTGQDDPVFQAIMRDPVAGAMNAVTSPLWGAGEAVAKGPVGQAVGRVATHLGQSVADAFTLPGDVLMGKAGQPTFDPMTGEVNQFPDDMVARGANAAGFMLSGETLPGAPRLVTAEGSPVPSKVTRAIDRDQIPIDEVGSRVSDLGDAGVVADLGDNTQKLTAGIASQPGAAGATITNAMRARAADATNRVPAAVNDVLGPATPPSALKADIRTNMKEGVSPLYKQVLANASPVDTSALAQSLDAEIPTLRGEAQADLKKVRAMLDDQTPVDPSALPDTMSRQDFLAALARAGGDVTKISADGGPKLDANASTLLQTRNAIDGIVAATKDTNVQRILGDARGQIDNVLAEAVPGIKDVDAQYRELARQRDAVDAGGNVLDGGKSAVWPQENAAAVTAGVQPEGSLVGPSAATFRLSQGARADIERIVGTKTNDRVALAGVMQGEGDWNIQKLAQLFGQDRADAIMNVVNNERQMAGTENLAVNGSKTAAVQAAQDDVNAPSAGPSALRAGANLHFGDMAFNALDKFTAGRASKAREAEHQQMADILMGRGDWQRVPGAAPTQMPLPIPQRQRKTTDDEMKAAIMGRQ